MQLQTLSGLDLFVTYCCLKIFFFIIKILGTLWGKYQVLGRGGNGTILEKGINPRFFAFSSTPSSGIHEIKTETGFQEFL